MCITSMGSLGVVGCISECRCSSCSSLIWPMIYFCVSNSLHSLVPDSHVYCIHPEWTKKMLVSVTCCYNGSFYISITVYITTDIIMWYFCHSFMYHPLTGLQVWPSSYCDHMIVENGDPSNDLEYFDSIGQHAVMCITLKYVFMFLCKYI